MSIKSPKTKSPYKVSSRVSGDGAGGGSGGEAGGCGILPRAPQNYVTL